MPAGTAKDRPVRVAATVVGCPPRLAGFEPVGNVFVRWLAVDRRSYRLFRVILGDVTPVVLTFPGGLRVLVPTLVVPPVPGLEHVEVQPGRVVEPLRGLPPPERVERHQVTRIHRLDGVSQRVPHVGVLVPVDVTAVEPHDVGAVAVPLTEKATVRLRSGRVDVSRLHHRSPDGHHRDVHPLARGERHDVVDVLPVVTRPTVRGAFGLGRAARIVVDERPMAVGVVARKRVNDHHLDDVEPFAATVLEVVRRLFAGQPLEHQPTGVREPEERTVAFGEKATARRHPQRLSSPLIPHGY